MKRNDLRGFIALALIPLLLLPQGAALAEFAIPGFTRPGGPVLAPPRPGALPMESGILPEGVTLDRSRPNHLEVNQSRDKVVIRWESFDIGSDASTHFNQQGNAGRVAVNRIADTGVPSQIFGRLTADGKLYLLNKNGILFGEGSQVNLHSLVATSLDPVDEQALLDGQAMQLQGTGAEGSILNEGTIRTKQGGQVIMVAPQVANAGEIDAPAGDVHLLGSISAQVGAGNPANLQVAGVAGNARGGSITSEAGFVGVWGNVVQQDGLIRAVTTIQKGGRVLLMAKEKVVTGAESETLADISASAATMNEKSDHQKGRIEIYADRVEHHGRIAAPAGEVTIAGSTGSAPADRIFLAGGSAIDVSGVWFDQSARQNLIDAELNSNELRDDHLQKDGVLRSSKITFNAVEGSTLGEVSGDLVKENITALERNTVGGKIRLVADEIILKDGALIDASGGGVRYKGDALSTTMLLSGNTIHSIGSAPPSLRYDKILGTWEKNYQKHGVRETISGFYTGGANSVGNYVGSYVQGKDAGSIEFLAQRLALDGVLLATAFSGRFQTELTEDVNDFGYQVTSGTRRAAGGVIAIGQEGQEQIEELADLDTPPSTTTPARREHLVQEILIRQEVDKLPGAFAADSPFPAGREGRTLLSAAMLNESGAQRISLRSNTTVTIERNAAITLHPGGVNAAAQLPRAGGIFEIQAREILHQGSITAPGGKVSLTTWDTAGSLDKGRLQDSFTGYTPGIYLDEGSVISVAGEEVDNWTAALLGRELKHSALLDGGEIVLQDKTWFAEAGGVYHGVVIPGQTPRQGVIVREGAVLDASGGYLIDASAKTRGGNAGSLTLQGANLVLDGDVRGYGYLGKRGGQITLHADSLAVGAGESWSPELDGGFTHGDLLQKGPEAAGYTLPQSRLPETGFTRVNLRSRDSIIVPSDVTLGPSRLKKSAPEPWAVPSAAANLILGGGGPQAAGGLLAVDEHSIGASAFSFTTNVKVTSTDNSIGADPSVTFAKGSSVATAPGGAITVTGELVTVAGALSARGGAVSLSARTGDLLLGDGAEISVGGYLAPKSKPLVAGFPAGAIPHDAGTVTLSAASGSISFHEQASIDISGSGPVVNQYLSPRGTVVAVTEQGRPGSLNLTYRNGLVTGEGSPADLAMLGITVNRQASLPGAALALRTTHETTPLRITGREIETLQELGFDDLAFASSRRIDLHGDIDADVGRRLVLDAPVIRGAGDGATARLSADWVTLANTSLPAAASGTDGLAGSALVLRGKWVDLMGDVVVQDYRTVDLLAQNDMRLFEAVYQDQARISWSGRLSVGGNLNLQASRIYPGKTLFFDDRIPDPNMYSHYALSAPAGKVTIEKAGGGTRAPIYSAGGKISILAKDLEHHGVLAAPMGSIDLKVSNRIFLGGDSLISTAGEIPVRYGMLDSSLDIWEAYRRGTTSSYERIAVAAPPDKAVSLDTGQTGTIVVMKDALIDTSGGGSIYGTRFVGSSSGTVNPFEPPADLELPRRDVVVPGMGFPGETIVVTSGSDILPAGVYSVVPDDLRDEFAFVPGAMVLTELGGNAASNWAQLPPGLSTTHGYPIIGGYRSSAGATFVMPRSSGFSVRRATDVMREGLFPRRSFASGRSGDLRLIGSTTVVDGTILGRAMDGFGGGLFAVSGSQSALVVDLISLDANFSFRDPIPVTLLAKSNIFAGGISNKGIGEVRIGDLGLTDTSEVKPNVTLVADSVTLAAKERVTIGSMAKVTSTAADGSVTLLSPAGKVSVGEGAEIKAANEVVVKAGTMDLAGKLTGDGSILRLASDLIRFVGNDYKGSVSEEVFTGTLSHGLVLYEDPDEENNRGLLSNLAGFDTMELTAGQGLEFYGKVDLIVPEDLVLSTSRIRGASDTTLAAGRIGLQGTGSARAAMSADGPSGAITFQAGEITVGPRHLVVDGYDHVTLSAAADIVFEGVGSLQTKGDLSLASARVANAPAISVNPNGVLEYSAGEFQVLAGTSTDRQLNFLRGGAAPGRATVPGGILEFRGKDISMAGLIDLESARVVLRAADSVSVRDGGSIRSLGGEHAPGGTVELRADAGNVVLDPGSLIDVSAGSQGDAGTIALSAVEGSVSPEGRLRGLASGPGSGGSLAVDTRVLPSFDRLAATLSGSGIDQEVTVRVRQGDVTLSSGVKAESFALSADGKDGVGGSIGIEASDLGVPPVIDASGRKGGTVRILAGRDLHFASGAIDAQGESDGGYVLLGSGSGDLDFGADAEVHLSGGTGAGGTVHFRAMRTADNKGMRISLAGSVSGATNMLAEGYRVYANQASLTTSTYLDHAREFYGNVDKPTGYTVLPGIEIRNDADLIVSSAWDLTSWNFGTADDPVPGVLTLRAGNNLNVNADLSSRRVGSPAEPSTQYMLQKDPGIDSWTISLAAGSDTSAADFLSVNVRAATGTGRNLSIGANAGVYTESSPLFFASGGDTIVNSSALKDSRYWMGFPVPVGIGTFDGDIRGDAGNALTLANGGVIVSATGDIRLAAGSVALGAGGSILTTGYRDIGDLLEGIDPELKESPYEPLIVQQSAFHWWTYKGGGDISLRAGESIRGNVVLNRWATAYDELELVHEDFDDTGIAPPDLFDAAANGLDGVEKYWLARYARPLQWGDFIDHETTPFDSSAVRNQIAVGVLAMAGGDVSISAGKDATLQAGTFGLFEDAKLSVSAGRELDGLFMARRGGAELVSMGNFGQLLTGAADRHFLETERASLDLKAMGNIILDGVNNPSLVRAILCRYGPGSSSASLLAVHGDVLISGRAPSSVPSTYPVNVYSLVPPDVSIRAGRDVRLSMLSLAPSGTGNLRIDAGRDLLSIDPFGNGIVRMTDMDPELLYNLNLSAMTSFGSLGLALSSGYLDLIHAGDPAPITIKAGRDIANITFDLPKQARITAARDITNISYTVQNVSDADVSLLKAGRDLIPQTQLSATAYGIYQYGPGALVVQAGNNINLGTTGGIQSLGNSGTGSSTRPKLPDKGASLLVVAGYDKEFDLAGVRTLFLKTQWEGVTETGEPVWKQKLFEAAKASESTRELTAEADSLQEIGLLFTEYRTVAPDIAQRYLGKGRELLAEFYGDSATENPDGGNIRMEKTRILSRDDGGDINILARGSVVVGRSNIQLPGEATAREDSSLGIFTERRGDIKIFAVKDVDVFESRVMSMFGGDIAIWSDTGNVNAGKGSKTQVSAPVTSSGEFRPPAVGSGVRTSTYDPDGPEGPLSSPEQGDAYVFAPEGIIDAGEAGISARNIYLGATQVLNAQNIQAAGVTVGAPVQVSGAANVGALSGSSSLADATRLIENTAGLAAERAEQMARPPQFTTQLLDVRVVNYLE